MNRRALFFVAVVVALTAWIATRTGPSSSIYSFEGVSGPVEETIVAQPTPTNIEEFGSGSVNRLAVLVTDLNSDWLGLVRGFKAHGIPFILTSDPAAALRHDVVIAYPSISGRVLDAAALRGLATHAREGGTLISFNLDGGGLEEVFGISSQTAARTRMNMIWLSASSTPEDSSVVFNSSRSEAQVGSYAFAVTTADVMATYDDGSVAATCRTVVEGRACLMGLDLGSLAQRAMNGRAALISSVNADNYQPSLDVLFRWVRDVYVAGEDAPYLIGTAPAGYDASLVLTHDVDYTRSVKNSVIYAEAIAKRGHAATFFIQTKYVRDWNDDIFFNSTNLPALKTISKTMELGSHSVSHSRQFANFSIGDGNESYPDYRPFVVNRESTYDGTVLGELQVSKFLIENLVETSVRSFRPGYLAHPENLSEALAATGYSYDSTLTANNALTHLPFQLTYARSGEALVPVWEFPVTIQDEFIPKLGLRFDATVEVVNKIARHAGLAVVLIHPDVTDHKLDFEEKLMDRMQGRLWIGSLGAFGDWWRARDTAHVDYADGVVTVNAPVELNKLTVFFPKGATKSIILDGVRGEQSISVR